MWCSFPLSSEIINQEMGPNTQVVTGEEDYKTTCHVSFSVVQSSLFLGLCVDFFRIGISTGFST